MNLNIFKGKIGLFYHYLDLLRSYYAAFCNYTENIINVPNFPYN